MLLLGDDPDDAQRGTPATTPRRGCADSPAAVAVACTPTSTSSSSSSWVS